MRKIVRILFGVALFSAYYSYGANHFTSISGDLSKITFDTIPRFYEVTGDIIVPAETQVSIPSGAILLFEVGAALRIDGNCTIGGTGPRQVILTSVNDTLSVGGSGKPTIYDWEGIIISQMATKVILDNVAIRYAEHPLTSNSLGLQLRNCVRMKTADEFIVLNGLHQNVEANVLFSYPQPPQIVSPNPVSVTQSTPQSIPHSMVTPPTRKHQENRKRWIRWTLLGSGISAVAAAGGWAAGWVAFDDEYNQQIENMKRCGDPDTETFDNITYHKAYDDSRDADENRQVCKIGGIVSGCIGTLLLTGFGLTFYF